MDAAAILSQLREQGVELKADGDRLRYRPKEVLTPTQLDELQRNKWALLALLAADDPEVRWRREAFRQQIPTEASRPVPFLCAVPGRHPAGRCLSCGGPFPAGDTNERLVVRCLPCVHAAWLALHDARGDES